MKKLILLFLIFGQILQAQDFTKPVRFLDKVTAYKYISVTDSVALKTLNLKSQSSRPSNPRVNTIINYNNVLQVWNGSTWNNLGIDDTTALKAWIKLKVAEDTALYAYNSENSVNSDTALYALISANAVNSDTSWTLQGWDTTYINTLLDTKEPTITRSPGYLKWDGANWVWKNEAYLNLNDSSGFKLETKTSNATKLGAKADTSLVNDTAYAIRQSIQELDDEKIAYRDTINRRTVATRKMVDSLILFSLTGKQDSIGTWNASGNLFPSTDVQKGDWWTISVKGFVGGTDSVQVNDLIIAKINNPGQTTTNWIINSAASSGVTVTGQKFNSSTKGVGVLYNGLTPLEGTLSGGSTSPVGTTAILDVNGNMWASGYVQSKSYIFANSSLGSAIVVYSNKTVTSYPTIYTTYSSSSISAYPTSATSSSKTKFGSIYNSSSFWNTTGAGSAERHAYRMIVDGTTSTSPVSYLNFGYAKNDGTELIASRLGMTGDWSHLLGANTYYLTSYTGGTVSQPVTNNKATSATSTGFNWYNYSGSAWTPIANLSNTGRATLAGGLRLPQDSLIIAGTDTVALKSDLVTLKGSQSIKIAGDSVALGDTIFKPIIHITNTNEIVNSESYTTGYNCENIYIQSDGEYSNNIEANSYGDYAYNVSLTSTGDYAYNVYLNTNGNGSMPIVANSAICDTLAIFKKSDIQVCRITGQGHVIANVTDTLTNIDRVANMIHDSIYQHYDTLSSTATVITYNAAVNPFRTDTIGENHTYHIDGAVNGSKGMLNVTITSTATLTFPSGVLADGQTFASLAAGVYNICWEKVQGTFNYNIKKYNSYTGY